MTGREFRLEHPTERHDLATFECGHPEMDAWLHRHALTAERMDSARTFLLTRGRKVIGYFSLTMGSVLRQEAPAKLVRGLPAYPLGVVLVARLAVHQDQHGKGFGGLLLAEALRKAVAAGDAAAARLVVVDAIDADAEAFYRHHGFIATPEHPQRLYRRTKDIRRSLEIAVDEP